MDLAERFLIDDLATDGVGGDLWAAKDAETGRDAHVGVLDASAPPALAASLVDDAQKLVGSSHDHVAAVLVCALDAEGNACVVFDIPPGKRLDAWLSSQKASSDGELETIAMGIAKGVGALHALGLVHGDVEPANFVLEPKGKSWLPKIGGFGLNRAYVRSGSLVPEEDGDPNALRSIAYAAPSQVAGGEPSSAHDVYSLGAVLHHLITAVAPEVGASVAASRDAARARSAPSMPSGLTGVRAKIGEVAASALAGEFADGGAVAKALEAAFSSRAAAEKAAADRAAADKAAADKAAADKAAAEKAAGPPVVEKPAPKTEEPEVVEKSGVVERPAGVESAASKEPAAKVEPKAKAPWRPPRPADFALKSKPKPKANRLEPKRPAHRQRREKTEPGIGPAPVIDPPSLDKSAIGSPVADEPAEPKQAAKAAAARARDGKRSSINELTEEDMLSAEDVAVPAPPKLPHPIELAPEPSPPPASVEKPNAKSKKVPKVVDEPSIVVEPALLDSLKPENVLPERADPSRESTEPLESEDRLPSSSQQSWVIVGLISIAAIGVSAYVLTRDGAPLAPADDIVTSEPGETPTEATGAVSPEEPQTQPPDSAEAVREAPPQHRVALVGLPDGAEVIVDGAPARLETELALEEGEHSIAVSAEGYERWERRVRAEEDTTLEVELTPLPRPDAPTSLSMESTPSMAEEDDSTQSTMSRRGSMRRSSSMMRRAPMLFTTPGF